MQVAYSWTEIRYEPASPNSASLSPFYESREITLYTTPSWNGSEFTVNATIANAVGNSYIVINWKSGEYDVIANWTNEPRTP